MKKLSKILIFAGFIIIILTIAGQLYTSCAKQKLLETAETVTAEPAADAVRSMKGLQEAFDDEDIDADTGAGLRQPAGTGTPEKSPVPQSETSGKPAPGNTPEKQKPAVEKTTVKPGKAQKALGILDIKKIGVHVPIVEGVKPENLRVGVGHIPGTAALGQVGNTAIAGHRSYTFGRFFNRLDELDTGDEIVITSNGNTYKYKVYEKLIVEPADTSVLSGNNKDRVLTIITCHPIYIASHRLIIHAKIEEPADETEKETAPAVQVPKSEEIIGKAGNAENEPDKAQVRE